MKIFVDTEFTQLGECAELISIGFAAADGRQWYGERDDFNRCDVSQFVRDNVLPLLGKRPECVYTGDRLRQAVQKWLQQFALEEGGAEICVDFNGDWTLLARLLEQPVPDYIMMCNVLHHTDETARKAFFDMTGLPEHHALYDALALRGAYRQPSIT